MAIDYKIDQVRLTQIIAESPPGYPGSPGRLIISSTKTSGTELFNGSITDTGFYNELAAQDIFLVISGSKFNVREPNQLGSNSGVVLFTGDVVMSASLVVATDQPTLYKPIQSISTSYFDVKDLWLTGSDQTTISNNLFAASDRVKLGNNVSNSVILGAASVNMEDCRYVSFLGSYGETVGLSSDLIDTRFSFLANTYNVNLYNSKNAFVVNSEASSLIRTTTSIYLNSTSTQIFDCTNYTALQCSSGLIENSSNMLTFNEQNSSISSSQFIFGANNVYFTVSSSKFAVVHGNIYGGIGNVDGSGVTGGGSPSPNTIIGNFIVSQQNCSGSVLIGGESIFVGANRTAVIGGNNITVTGSATSSFLVQAENVTVTEPYRMIFGTPRHISTFSGSLVAGGISGSHNYLIDGTTQAFSTFATQSGPTQIATASNGQVQFGALTTVNLGNYIVSFATESNPEVAGAAFINRYEHEDVQNIPGAYAKFRCILATGGSDLTASVKLWNASDSAYVALGPAAETVLSTTSSTPVALVSNALTSSSVFDMNNKVYEVHVYISGSGSPAIVSHYKSEFLFAPQTLSGYS